MLYKTESFRRRGAAAATVAISGTVLIGFAALAVDMGVFYNSRIEAQRSADAAALAGAWKLLGEERIKGPPSMTTLVQESRQSASDMAALNYVFKQGPLVDLNLANSPSGDIVLGRLERPTDRTEPLANDVDPFQYNAISVLVRRDDVRNGPVPFYFGQIFGLKSKNVSAKAVAMAQNRIAGFRIMNPGSNVQLLPFAVHVDAWAGLMDQTWSTGDNFSYDPDTKTVLPGSDGIYELNMYPGSGNGADPGNPPKESDNGQLPPGNFGTVDIGNPNNSTADLKRQILYGINESDLAFHGGELRLDSEGKLYLNGDTGLSAGIKAALETIKGQPRAIPLFTHVAGPGNNATYTVVGFVGVRIMHVKLTGSMKSKAVTIQPAVVIEDNAIVDESVEPNQLVWTPPTLVR